MEREGRLLDASYPDPEIVMVLLKFVMPVMLDDTVSVSGAATDWPAESCVPLDSS